jgi:predicted lipoprotein with Yx(FWY)xxD motif
MQLTTRLALRTAGVAVAGAVLLAACGSSGTNYTSAGSGTTPTSAAAPATPTSPAPTVSSKPDPTLGTILADAKGHTLYTLTNNGKAVDCTAACAATWPPLAVASGTMPTVAPGAGSVGTTTLSDGTNVVTIGGLPLYRFVKDQDAGDAYGEGLSSFGGVWHVVKTAQSTAAGAPATPPATTAGTEMSGY